MNNIIDRCIYKIEPENRKFFTNRTAILGVNDEKIVVIEHYKEDINVRMMLEDKILNGLNKYDILLEALKQIQKATNNSSIRIIAKEAIKKAEL